MSSLKHELENKTAFYVRLLADEVEKASEKFAKKYNMSQEDAHKLLVAKIIEKDMDALGRTGFHPSDALINPDKEGNIYSIMDKYGGKDRIWHDKTLDNMAGKMQKLNEDYGLKEAAMRGSEVNTSFGYMALRLTDDAEKAAQRQAALQITHSGGQRPVSMQHGAQIARATNRHFYPVANPATADWLDDTGQGWNYIFSKEVAEAMDAGTTNKLPAEYQAYRLAKMREPKPYGRRRYMGV